MNPYTRYALVAEIGRREATSPPRLALHCSWRGVWLSLFRFQIGIRLELPRPKPPQLSLEQMLKRYLALKGRDITRDRAVAEPLRAGRGSRNA